MKNRKYGCIPDTPDKRDLHMVFGSAVTANLPRQVDLRPQMPAVYDQGNLGSCVFNGGGACIHYAEMLQAGGTDLPTSRLFSYWDVRNRYGDVQADDGAQIRDAMKSYATTGVCPETLWGYDESKFATRPTDDCWAYASGHRILKYTRVQQTLDQMKACLAEGFPFCCGFQLYESFESDGVAETGIVPLPGPLEQSVGGHAMAVVGYDDETQRFVVRNSWGVEWGHNGYCTVPYRYLALPRLVSDLWTVRLVVD